MRPETDQTVLGLAIGVGLGLLILLGMPWVAPFLAKPAEWFTRYIDWVQSKTGRYL